MHKFNFQVMALGINNSKYPGAFTEPVKQIIKDVTYGKILHLYSGSSFIGEERVDLTHPNATLNCKVEDFIVNDKRNWDWVLLDPPYANAIAKTSLEKYADIGSLSCNVKWRNKIKVYFRKHVQNILWLDYCAPMITGFRRERLWLLLPGGYHNVRILSWLQKTMEPMF